MKSYSKKVILLLWLLVLALPLHVGLLAFPKAILDITDNRELECLARNIYYESRGEPFWGKVAVAQVTINRVLHDNYPKTLCGVVYQPSQFSWTLHNNLRIRDTQAWKESLVIARAVADGLLHIPNFPAIYFHAQHVKPYWHKTKDQVQTIGNHIFYY